MPSNNADNSTERLNPLKPIERQKILNDYIQDLETELNEAKEDLKLCHNKMRLLKQERDCLEAKYEKEISKLKANLGITMDGEYTFECIALTLATVLGETASQMQAPIGEDVIKSIKEDLRYNKDISREIVNAYCVGRGDELGCLKRRSKTQHRVIR